MPIPLGTSVHYRRKTPPPAPPPQRRSLFRRAFGSVGWIAAAPSSWAGTARIRRSAALIGDLTAMLRAGPTTDRRFKTEDGGVFDLRATAFSYGVSVADMERRLAARRRQTARIAYATFALACLFLLAWIWTAASTPWHAVRVNSVLDFLPFCGLFVLVSFYNALLNYQIRTGRLASWWDYLMTDQGFWPR